MATSPQQRTAKARQAFADKFSTPQERSAYFADLAARSHQHRLTLSGEERAALAAVYDLLASIAERHGLNQSESTGGVAGKGGAK